jgi:hypothetical protein
MARLRLWGLNESLNACNKEQSTKGIQNFSSSIITWTKEQYLA